MTDRENLHQILLSRHPLVTIQTFEEEYVLLLIRELAVNLQTELWTWTVTEGLREGLLANSALMPDTDNPAALLYMLAHERRPPAVYVLLDLAGHLKDERTMRSLREAVTAMASSGGQIIMIDQAQTLPPIIASLTG